MRLPLRSKLIALTTTIVALVMADVTYFLTIRENRARRAAVTGEMERIARSVATLKLLDRQDWSVYQNFISQLIKLNDDVVYIAVYDDRQKLRAQAVNFKLIEPSKPAADLLESSRAEEDLVRQLDQGQVAEESRSDLLAHRVNIEMGDRVLGSVHVGFSLIDVNDELTRWMFRNVAMAVVLVLASGALAFLLGRRLTRPLERLSGAMEAIAAGDLGQRVRIETHDEIADLSRRFNEMVEQLRERQVIDRLGQELGGTFQFERLARLVRERLSGAVGAEHARLHVRRHDRAGSFVEVVAADGPGPRVPAGAAPGLLLGEAEQGLARGLADGFMLASAPALAPALAANGFGERDFVIPMLVQGELFGLLTLRLGAAEPGLDPKRRHFVVTLARQAALALENALLYEDLREQERLKSELEIARVVQKDLLPSRMPAVSGFEIDGLCQPAFEVGGDYFDFFDLGEGQLGVVIADVSGKGTSASFYMAEIKGMMLALTSIFPSPRRLLAELNRRLYRSLDARIFASMIYGVLDPIGRRFTFARAGHNAPLHLRPGREAATLTPSGMALALDPGPLFDKVTEEWTLTLGPGEALVLYTDGITEAMNGEREPFGTTRLVQALEGLADGEAGARAPVIRERILGAIARYSDGEAQADDVTMVVLASSPHRTEIETPAPGEPDGDRAV